VSGEEEEADISLGAVMVPLTAPVETTSILEFLVVVLIFSGFKEAPVWLFFDESSSSASLAALLYIDYMSLILLFIGVADEADISLGATVDPLSALV
jgi:hypothetical protein